MHEMYDAENKNESRLERMYREGDMDENESYSYSQDDNNLTGSASILVWRAMNQNDTVTTSNLEEKVRAPAGLLEESRYY
jgi:hypothetical protein